MSNNSSPSAEPRSYTSSNHLRESKQENTVHEALASEKNDFSQNLQVLTYQNDDNSEESETEENEEEWRCVFYIFLVSDTFLV
jgi:hypothetical protein